MGRRNRTRSGKGILIAVVLGPLCAAAADLPGRVVATPAEPVACLGIQTFEHAKVSPGDIATVSKVRSIRKRQNTQPTVAQIDLPELAGDFPEGTLPRPDVGYFVRLHWLENPTSTGP